MKKLSILSLQSILLLQLLPFTLLHAQSMSGSLFGTSYSFDKPSMSGRGSGSGGSGRSDNWSSGNTNYTPAPTSSETITKAYQGFASQAYNKGIEAWKKKDWNSAIRFFNRATIYNEKNASYQKALNDAKGYKQWDEGVKQAEKQNWDKAIEHYKNALEYLPNDKTLKNNIIGCSYNKTSALADKYFTKGDYISAAVYYQVLWKNFGNNNMLVQDRYAQSYTKISAMKQSEGAYVKFNAKLQEVKNELPFINDEWK